MFENMCSKRKMCWEDTKMLCYEQGEENEPNESIKIKYSEDLNKTKKKRYPSSNILFYDMDTIDCALGFENPLVLNLADNYFPGGYVDEGAGAQEESIFRRSNYFKTLKKSLYPIEKDEAIYSSNVSIIKRSENDNWSLYDSYKRMDFIACPGIKYPGTILKDNIEQLNNIDVEQLKIKIKTIIQCAIHYNHDTIIFGALGCGAWKNPPFHVAKIFKEILDEYNGVIKNYVFSILSIKNVKKNFVLSSAETDLLSSGGVTNFPRTIDIFIEVFGKSIENTQWILG